jgi:ADP-ribosylglycohydrolase
MKIDLRSKFIGCMVGSAIGDAIGEIAFFYPEKDELLKEVARVKELIYTDDTAMAVALPGAYLGVEAIPEAWRKKLENLSTIVRLASSILEMAQET